MPRASSAVAAALVGVAGISTSACIPIPLMSGYDSSSRQNVPAQVPGFIVNGQTTRTDVVFALGEPDRHADDGSWLLYSSVYRNAGLAMVFVGGGAAAEVSQEKMRYRILTIRFDAAGVVSSTDLKERSCPEWSAAFSSGTGSSVPNPCFDISGDDIVAADRAATAAPGERLVATYGPVVWWQRAEHPPDLKFFSKPREQGVWADLAITETNLLLTPSHDSLPGSSFAYSVVPLPDATRLQLASITAVSARTRGLVPYVTISFSDGSRCNIQIMTRTGNASYIWDNGQTKAVGALIEERVRAAVSASPAAVAPP